MECVVERSNDPDLRVASLSVCSTINKLSSRLSRPELKRHGEIGIFDSSRRVRANPHACGITG